jgi:hypothetical protein
MRCLFWVQYESHEYNLWGKMRSCSAGGSQPQIRANNLTATSVLATWWKHYAKFHLWMAAEVVRSTKRVCYHYKFPRTVTSPIRQVGCPHLYHWSLKRLNTTMLCWIQARLLVTLTFFVYILCFLLSVFYPVLAFELNPRIIDGLGHVSIPNCFCFSATAVMQFKASSWLKHSSPT